MKKILLSFFFTALSLFAADGQSLSAKCVACHGASFEKAALGKSAIVYGQSASDIYSSLLSYKQGTRNTAGMGALMKGQTASMSNNDLWAIAEYVASLSEEPAPAAEAAPANDWPYVCEQADIANFGSKRYFFVAGNDYYPAVMADSQSIKIDKKNKFIRVWTVWLASYEGRADEIKGLDQYANYSNYGYLKQLILIDYKNMRQKGEPSTDYNCDGNVITSGGYESKWKNISPDSMMEGITRMIMKKYKLK